jgi:hypothetical protein
VRRLLVAASVVPSSPILVTLMKEARRNIPEDGILRSHRRENLKSLSLSVRGLRDSIMGGRQRHHGRYADETYLPPSSPPIKLGSAECRACSVVTIPTELPSPIYSSRQKAGVTFWNTRYRANDLDREVARGTELLQRKAS